MTHNFCSHCDCRNTDLFAVNQQLGERIESLKAEIECLKEQVEYYKAKSEGSTKTETKTRTPKYIDAEELRKAMFSYYGCLNENTSKDNYGGETLMVYEVADMINDCIDNAIEEAMTALAKAREETI